MTQAQLLAFVIKAKKATYVGDGEKAPPARPGSHDLVFDDGIWSYRDSYFGGTDFLGQEAVWHGGEPVWAMNYYGYVLRPDLIDGARAAETLRAAHLRPQSQGRLLDNFTYDGSAGRYEISSEGDVTHFKGRETITVGYQIAYALDYHGGLVKP